MLPPSTVITAPVVLGDLASATKACATSAAVTSRPSRLPPMYCCSLRPRALERWAIISSVSRLERMRSALTAFDRMASPPWSTAYWRLRNSVAALGSP